MVISLIVGISLGMFSGFQCYSRTKSGANRVVVRNPDGSIFGGLIRVVVGVVILWFLLGFGVTYGITALAGAIF